MHLEAFTETLYPREKLVDQTFPSFSRFLALMLSLCCVDVTRHILAQLKWFPTLFWKENKFRLFLFFKKLAERHKWLFE